MEGCNTIYYDLLNDLVRLTFSGPGLQSNFYHQALREKCTSEFTFKCFQSQSVET